MNNPYIPLFYHIPRCAGTYAIWLMRFSLIVYLKKKYPGLKSQDYIALLENRVSIEITHENLTYFRIIAMDFKKICQKNNLLFKRASENGNFFKLDRAHMDKINKFDIYAMVIEPRGFRKIKEFFNFFSNLRFKSFMLIRDPYEQYSSYYFYLKNEISKHESTHGAYKDLSFEDYLQSSFIEDSWLIREISNLSNDQVITDKHYLETIEALKDISIYQYKDVDKAVSDIFLACYGISLNNFIKLIQSHYEPYKNKSTKKNPPLASFPPDIQEKYLKRSFWAYKIFNFLIQ